jgi:deoxyribose-phosphate aldolase
LTSDGKATLNKKLEEAQKAIENGADDLDFVVITRFLKW